MKSILKATSILLLSFITISALFATDAIAGPEEFKFEVGSKIKVPRMKMKAQNTFMLDYKCDDVTGDGIKDNIVLAGYKPGGESDSFSREIYLLVQDGKSKKFSRLPPGKINSGYEPKLFTGDFNGDKVSDIFVSIGSGGSGGISTYRLISYKNKDVISLFDDVRFSQGLRLGAEFRDAFKAAIIQEELNATYIVDISSKKEDYIKMDIYNAEGRLTAPVKGMVNPYHELKPEDTDEDGVYELKGMQRATGTANADTIAYVESEWKFICCRFELKGVKVISAKE